MASRAPTLRPFVFAIVLFLAAFVAANRQFTGGDLALAVGLALGVALCVLAYTVLRAKAKVP